MNSRLKKRLAAAAALLFVLSLLGYAIYYTVFSNRRITELAPDSIVEVDRGDLTSVFMTSARVGSGQQGVYEILDGTRVLEVHVRVGDAVQQGDLLATFDAGSLDEMLRARRRDYENARNSYNDYIRNMNNAPNQAAALRAQIAEVEARIAEMQAAEPETPGQPAEAPTPEGNQQLEDLRQLVAGLMGNTRVANWMVDMIFAETGSVAQTVTAFQNLMSGSLLGGLGGLGGMGSFDMSAMMGGMGSMMNTELLGASMQLMQLRMQETMLGLQVGGTLDNVYKSLADSAESAYRQAERTVAQLKGGWYAAHNGVVREVNVNAGEVYRSGEGESSGASMDMTAMLAMLAMGQGDIGSMIGGLFGGSTVSGMTIEYYPFNASFLLGRYDIAKIELDQKVIVTSVSGAQFDGVVSFISPVAAQSGGVDLGAIMGGGGGSARGVEARVTIPQPDLSITIGLDVDVTIELESRNNVLRVPVSAMRYDSESETYFVYALERADRTVRRVDVGTGLFDNSGAVAWYEITEGLREGEEILRAPPHSMRDGDRVRIL